MTRHDDHGSLLPGSDKPDCGRVQPKLAEYTLGFLEPGEHALVEAHLGECVPCTAACRAAGSDLAPLGRLLTDSTGCPPAFGSDAEAAGAARHDRARLDEMWSRIDLELDAEVEAETEKLTGLVESTLPSGSRYASGVGAPWVETGIPGVRAKFLHVDAQLDTHTLLVQMDPGAMVPAHHHHGVEEAYVLEGDLFSAGELLRAGDYQRLDANSDHAVQVTQGGCLAIIIGSPRDFG